MKWIIYMGLIAVALFAACSGVEPDGRLGITVPEGREPVTDEAPYLVAGAETDGPAYRAGIRPNDRILRINGKEVGGMRYDDVRNLLRGPAGSMVTVTVDRGGVPPRDYSFTRGFRQP